MELIIVTTMRHALIRMDHSFVLVTLDIVETDFHVQVCKKVVVANLICWCFCETCPRV